MKTVLWFAILVCFLSCQEKQKPPVPFKTQVAGQAIGFPITVGQLLKNKQTTHKEGYVQLVSGVDSLSVNWFYNWTDYSFELTQRADRSSPTPLYGMAILIPNKAAKIDSVKKWLEHQLGKPMSLLAVEHINLANESTYVLRQSVYTCVPSRGTRVSLRKGEWLAGDYHLLKKMPDNPGTQVNPQNLLRIAISYGLSPDEEERFAIGNGSRAWREYD